MGRVLTATVFGDDGSTDAVPDVDQISDVLAEARGLLWVDVLDPTEDDLAVITKEFELAALAMEDVRQRGQRPRIERYDTHVYLVAYASADDPQDLSEVDIFLAQGWLITIRRRNAKGDGCLDVDELRGRFERTRADHNTVGMLLYTLLDTIVDSYFDTLDRTEDELEVIEGRIFTARSHEEAALQQRLLALRRELLLFRRRVVPLRDVLQVILRQEVQPIRPDVERYFQDVLDHILRVIDTLETQRELLGNAVDAHLAVVNNNMNQIMKKMTSWGAILFGAALISGIYGMNFRNMPELQWHYGYYMALGLMLALTVGLYLWFRHRDWL
jgi:magnesium transporter